MVKMNVVYEGALRCKLTHEQSGTVISTDAPKDNMGKGESFSPTDLVAAALSSCMMTVMGIVAQRHNINIEGSRIDVTKEMVTAPVRRIGTIAVNLYMPKALTEEQRKMLENAAHTCPVHKSLHPDVVTPITFHYSE